MALDTSAVATLRSEFNALNPPDGSPAPAFFCGPGGSQAHGSVLEAMNRYLTEANSNAHGSFLYSHRTDEVINEARQAMADFLNAPRADEIVFGPNMTTLTFRISQAIGKTIKPGDEVVVTRLDHDANIAPWLGLEDNGALIRFVDFNPDDCTLDLDAMKKAITPKTRIVAVGYASNAFGTVNDVRRVTEWAHEVGAVVYVDAVHYAPHGSLDVQAIGCDFLACSPYKFFGPHHGAVWGKYELLNGLPAAKVRPAGDDPPDKFETGTGNFEAFAGTTAAVDYLASVGRRFGMEYQDRFPGFSGRKLELRCAMAAIGEYETALCKRMIEGIGSIDGIKIHGITDPVRFDHRVPTVSFTSEKVTPQEIAKQLGERNMFVWNGHFYAWEAIQFLGLLNKGGVVRVGILHYNTIEEVDALITALEILHG